MFGPSTVDCAMNSGSCVRRRVRRCATHAGATCICASTNFKRSAAGTSFVSVSVVCRGNSLVTRRGGFRYSSVVACDGVSVRLLGGHHRVGALCRGVSFRPRAGVGAVCASVTVQRATVGHVFSGGPFARSSAVGVALCNQVDRVRAANLTAHLRRVRIGGVIVNISNKLSSPLTLLVYTETTSALSVPHEGVVNIAVRKFNAAGHACAGTARLVAGLNTALLRVPVGSTYLRRFGSVSRGPRRHSAACRGSRTHRHARVLVSLTGGRGTLIVNANSVSRLTLN